SARTTRCALSSPFTASLLRERSEARDTLRELGHRGGVAEPDEARRTEGAAWHRRQQLVLEQPLADLQVGQFARGAQWPRIDQRVEGAARRRQLQAGDLVDLGDQEAPPLVERRQAAIDLGERRLAAGGERDFLADRARIAEHLALDPTGRR